MKESKQLESTNGKLSDGSCCQCQVCDKILCRFVLGIEMKNIEEFPSVAFHLSMNCFSNNKITTIAPNIHSGCIIVCLLIVESIKFIVWASGSMISSFFIE